MKDASTRSSSDDDRAALKALVVSAAAWSVATYGMGFAMRIGGNLVLTRLLSPEDFGLMTLISTVIAGLFLLSDFGVAPCIVRSPRGDDPVFRDTAWTLGVVRGSVLFVLACIVAAPASRFYESPDLAYLIPALGFGTFLLGSFRSTKEIAAQRHLEARKISILELGNQLITLMVTVAWALVWPSIWALIAGAIVSSFTHVWFSFQFLSGRNDRPAWEKDALRELATFGRWVLLSTALMFCATQTDRIILGKLVSLATLGVIGLGLQLAELPKQLLQRLCSHVLLPAMSKIAHLPRSEFRALIARQRRRVLPLGAVVVALGFTMSDILISLMYDARYHEAGWVFALMLLGSWVGILTMSIDPALFALGKPVYGTVASGVGVVMNFVAIPVGFAWYGVVGAIGALVAKQVAHYIVIFAALYKEKLSCGRQDLALSGLFLAVLSALVGGRFLLGFGHPLTAIMP